MAQLYDDRSNKRFYLLLVALLSGVAGVCSWLFESRLQGRLVSLVEQHLGVYLPDITGLAAALIFAAIPLYLALRSPANHDYGLRYEGLVTRLKRRIILLLLAVVLLLSLSAAVYQLHLNAPTPEQVAIDVDLNEDLPAFLFLRKVSLKGVPVTKYATFSKDLRQSSSTMLRRYTPIANSTSNESPVRFVESFTSDSTKVLKNKKASLQGFVSLRLLPASIRNAFEADGLVMARFVYVIEDRFFDVRPYLFFGWILLLLAASLCFIRLLLSSRIHQRKLQAAWDHQHGYSKNKNVKNDIMPWARK